jgi:hypothetical protein
MFQISTTQTRDFKRRRKDLKEVSSLRKERTALVERGDLRTRLGAVTGRVILYDYRHMNDASNDGDAHGEETHISQTQSDIDFMNDLLATQQALRGEVKDFESQLATQKYYPRLGNPTERLHG